jgi:L-cysteine S-thiosulfotransferase
MKMKRTGFFAVAGIVLLPSFGMAAAPAGDPNVAKGKAVAFDMNKGNCLACHMMGDGEYPGNFGPPLSQMKERYPDRAVLRKQIWDATARNPASVMPPFGKHGILTESEGDEVVDYVYTL